MIPASQGCDEGHRGYLALQLVWWLVFCWVSAGQELPAHGRERGPRSPEAPLLHPQTSPALLCPTLTHTQVPASQALGEDTGDCQGGDSTVY